MKLLLYKSVLFLIPVLLVCAIVEFKLRKIPNSYSYKKYNLEKRLSQIEVLILGSSHTYYGIDPDQLHFCAYNMANVNQTLYYDKMLVGKYIDRMKSLKTIIVPISYFTLEKEPDSDAKVRYFYYKRYYDIDFPEFNVFDYVNLRRYSLIALYGDRTTGIIKDRFHTNIIENIMENGWFKYPYKVKELTVDVANKRISYHHSLMKQEFAVNNIRILDELIRKAKGRNVNIVFVTLPTSQYYNNLADKHVLLRKERVMKELCDKYHMKYLDYFADKRFNDEDFFDSDHLNGVGAEKFSPILDKDLRL